MREIDLSDRQTNLRLKLEVLRLATRVSASSLCTTVADYALIRGELDGLEISEQNHSLNYHLLVLQEIFQDTLLRLMQPRDSIVTHPPSAQLAPASSASAAGVHAVLKRGREDEQSSPVTKPVIKHATFTPRSCYLLAVAACCSCCGGWFADSTTNLQLHSLWCSARHCSIVAEPAVQPARRALARAPEKVVG